MFLAVVSMASARPPDAEAVAAFTQWHCSAANPLRYDGPLHLAPFPPQLATVGSFAAMAAAPEVYEVGVTGASGSLSARWLAIDGDAPMETVTAALADYGSGLEAGESRALLFAVDERTTPRPPLPLTGGDAKRYTALIANRGPLDPAAAEECPLLLVLERVSCDQSVARIGGAIGTRTCGAGTAPLLLAWLTLRTERGDGVPVALVPVLATGTPIGGTGRWGEVARSLVGQEPLALRSPDDASPASDPVRFDPAALSIARRVPSMYPEEAKSLFGANTEFRCEATVQIDEQGVPFQVAVAGCPAAFHDAVRQSLLQWRWFPPKIEGRPVKAMTTIAVVFKLT